MADIPNAATRFCNMSRIKGKNTKPKMTVQKFLFANKTGDTYFEVQKLFYLGNTARNLFF